MSTSIPHRYRFSRFGGFDQARIDTADDLASLADLDQKLWAALACPVKGLEFDAKTLALIDADLDGRVRAPEVIAAVRWAGVHLKDLAALKAGSNSLPLGQIDDRTDSGRAILASAKQILKDLGKPDAAAISLADVVDTERLFAQTRFNGDGIVPALAAADAAVQKTIEDVIECLGAKTDRSGKPGIDRETLDKFFAEMTSFADWAAKFDVDSSLRPLGEATTAAADARRAVRAKVDDYFARCRLAAFDVNAVAALNRTTEQYAAAAAGDLSATAQEVAAFPIARIEPGRALPLETGVNPAWAAAIATLRAAVVAPLVGAGRTSLTAEEWESIGAKFHAHETWLASKPVTAVEKLGLARVREILAGPAKAEISKLIGQDAALQVEFEAIAHVERLVRYHRDLYRLLNNFVNFSDFYSKDRQAIFQAGTLYLDARACELCVRVEDAGRHAALAGLAKAYLAYCDCTRPSGEKMTIAAAFTDGDSDYLMVGRNGIFYDRQGRDWDAAVVKVIENPISVRQAFWSPYKKFVRFIEEQVAKRAAAAHSESDAKVAAAAATTANADQVLVAERPPEPKKIDVGTVAAMGVAVGAIGTALAFVVGQLSGLTTLPFWELCLAFLGLLLLISTPSMLIAWLKLKQRNLGPILDANGWAVNGRVKMNVSFGASLTSVGRIPEGSIPAVDPFGERRSPWPAVVKIVVLVCFLASLANWYGLIYVGLEAAGVKKERIPPIVTSPDDVRSREKKAAMGDDKTKTKADAGDDKTKTDDAK